MARRAKRNASFAAACLCLTLLVSCKERRTGPEPIGVVYVAPLTLNIREAIQPRSKTVASLKHGDKLDVMQTRRRFVRVRTTSGIEGWTEMRQLLSTDQMEALAQFSKNAAAIPAQGQATVYDVLNMHSEPLRQSPSFYQIQEGALVDVLAHAVSPRAPGELAPVIPFKRTDATPAKTKKQLKKEEQDRKYPPPPMPRPPKPPADWLELSKSVLPPEPPEPEIVDATGKKRKKRRHAQKPTVPSDDWTLVRTKEGKAGWVVSRMLRMAIPDEVAQYSEGARITSYFPLATINDEGQTKHHWLWTTMSDGVKAYDFDSYRVFIWNLRKHRYETSYIQRGVIGYYPVEAKGGANPSFSLIMQTDADDQIYRYTFRMEGYITRFVSKEPVTKPEPLRLLAMGPSEKETEEQEVKSFTDRLKGLVKFGK